jgi:hypothetical protein
MNKQIIIFGILIIFGCITFSFSISGGRFGIHDIDIPGKIVRYDKFSGKTWICMIAQNDKENFFGCRAAREYNNDGSYLQDVAP